VNQCCVLPPWFLEKERPLIGSYKYGFWELRLLDVVLPGDTIPCSQSPWFVVVHQLRLLLVDISHYFFNYSKLRGWSTRDLLFVKEMLCSWRVLSEEVDGPNGAPLEHVTGKW
jgi:hypothetical protein